MRKDRTDGPIIDLDSLAGPIESQNLPFEKVLGTGPMHLFILAHFVYAAKFSKATLFHNEVIPIYCWDISNILHYLRVVHLLGYFLIFSTIGSLRLQERFRGWKRHFMLDFDKTRSRRGIELRRDIPGS